jgi:hypothetical protein
MTEFWKRPKFWVNLILIVWLAYLIGSNIGLSVQLHLVPMLAIATVQVSTIIALSILLGVLALLWIQFLWRRWRSSNQASPSTAAPESSRSTAA